MPTVSRNGPYLAGLLAVSVLALAACSKGGGTSSAGGGEAAKAGGGPDTVITEADLPRIKAGKWQKVETGEDGKSETSSYCESGKAIQMHKPDKAQCAKFEIKRTFLGGIVMDMQCGDPAQYVMSAHATASGDFNSHVTSDSTMTLTVPGKPATTTKIHTEMTYLGACDPGEKPENGDN
jgi:hypothetical protein